MEADEWEHSLCYHLVDVINFSKISEIMFGLFTVGLPKSMFSSCYHSVNVISLSKSQSDPIKRRLLFSNLKKKLFLTKSNLISFIQFLHFKMHNYNYCFQKILLLAMVDEIELKDLTNIQTLKRCNNKK